MFKQEICQAVFGAFQGGICLFLRQKQSLRIRTHHGGAFCCLSLRLALLPASTQGVVRPVINHGIRQEEQEETDLDHKRLQ